MNQRTEVAVFGGGCFWCTEAVFERLKGVISVAPGYAGEDQKRQAEAVIEQLNNSDPRGRGIVTEVSPLDKFYEAEDYHHEYYRNNFAAPYCQFVIEPKLEKLHAKFKALLRASVAIE